MVERSAGSVSSPHSCHREALLFPLWFYVILTVFIAVMINVEHTTLVLAGLVLSCSTEVWRKHTRRRAERQRAGLVSAE